MIKNKIYIRTIISLALSFSLIAVPMSASAMSTQTGIFASSSGKAACQAITALNPNDATCGSNSQSGVNSFISTIITILSIIVGIVAVIMIILSGMKFITSGGDSQKVSSAKSGLIYALVGLVVVALAQAILYFVVNAATTPGTASGG